MARTIKFWCRDVQVYTLVASLACCLLGHRLAEAEPTPANTLVRKARASDPGQVRLPSSEDELRRWLQLMVWDYSFTDDEIQAAIGLEPPEIKAARERFGIAADSAPSHEHRAGVPRLLPYPGGRHPRIGFRDGAINPQRETKAGVFTPWDPQSYVVLDIPEAIFSNLGLIYLAHTHVATIWEEQGIKLKRLEWRQDENGALEIERSLPNGISFGTRLTPCTDAVLIDMWIKNGTTERLSGLRSQWCALLRGADDFAAQTNDNKLFWRNYSACRNNEGTHWIILAATPSARAWGNPPCPCLHTDPQFADCEPGATVRARGRLSFYQGRDIEAELRRIEATGWHPKEASAATPD